MEPIGIETSALRWDELGPGMRPDRYTVETLPRRLSSQRADAWERFFDVRQSLDPARARVTRDRARDIGKRSKEETSRRKASR